jgi:hypothetical protein
VDRALEGDAYREAHDCVSTDVALSRVIRWALARFAEGDDLGDIISEACRESYRIGHAAGAPFADETTPRVNLWPDARPSERPTAPAPAVDSGKTIPSFPPPPPMPRGVKR